MSVSLIVDNEVVNVSKVTFSDGASSIKVDDCNPQHHVSVTLNETTPMDHAYWEIVNVYDAVSSMAANGTQYTLNLPYLPHGRADRVFEKGNSSPLRLFSQCFNLFDNVLVDDPHNEEALADLTNVHIVHQQLLFKETVMPQLLRGRYDPNQIVIVAPDKGAKDKANLIADKIGGSSFLQASKVRDVSTGRIIETTVPDCDLTGKVCIITDDIADGGGTFVPLAKKLRERGAKEVHLYVTHGIFAKGLNLFKGIIDKIYMHHAVGTHITQGDVLNFNEGKEVK